MKHNRIQRALNLSLCLVFLFSGMGVPPVQAGTGVLPGSTPSQSLPAAAYSDAAPTPPPPPGARLGYNSVTGRLNFVGSDAAAPLASAGELSAMGVRSAADGVLAQYAPQFGVQNPAKDLRLARTAQDDNGSVMRYQQQYQGIPILGGELIVNSDTQGQVLSLNGEVSPDLALSGTTPAISSEQALQAALAGAKLWYGLDASQVVAGQPALWVYDPRILNASNEPVSLVWRIELSSKIRPVVELVLVDAANGTIALHFNQVADAEASDGEPTPTVEPTPKTPTDEQTQDTPAAQPTDTPPTQPTTAPTPVPLIPDLLAPIAPQDEIQSQSGVIWYVSTTGSNENDCATPSTPCSSIKEAIARALDGDVIEIAVGTYTGMGTEVVKIAKNVNLSGGWNESFIDQTGYSTLDGEYQRRVMIIGTGDKSTSQLPVVTTLERLIVTHGNQLTFISIGSGIFADANSSVTIKNSSIQHNIGKEFYGEALVSYRGTSLNIINSTISENQGGIYAFGDLNVEIRNTTITRNQTNGYMQTGGLDLSGYSQRTQLVLLNSIIANNIGNYAYTDCSLQSSTILLSGYNLITKCENYTAAQGDVIGKNAKLGILVPDGFYPLLSGSPAIDGGNPDPPGSGGAPCETTDQTGVVRPIDGNSDGTAVCDIGSFETELLTAPAFRFLGTQGESYLTARVNNGYSPLAVIAQDQYGSPVPGIGVIFTAPDSGPSGFFDSGVTQITVTTDANGIATAPPFIANGIAGRFHLIAAVPEVTEAVYYLENYIPTPTSITLGSDSDTVLGRTRISTLQMFVWDQFSRPIQGAEVTVTAPDSGPSLILTGSGNNVATNITGVDGKATFPATANEINGTYSITVVVNDLDQPLIIALTNSTFYIGPNGSDYIGGKTNDCKSPDFPCLTVINLYGSTTPSGSSFLMQSGELKFYYFDNRWNGVRFSGGWDGAFASQTGRTIIDGSGKSEAFFNIGGLDVEINRINFINATTGIRNIGTLTLEDVGVSHNGTGLYNETNGVVHASNSTFSENRNGIGNYGNLDLRNVTIDHNTNTGIFQTVDYDHPTEPVSTIQNSIISNNTTNCWIYFGSITSNGYNLFDSTVACGVYSSSETYIPNISDLISVDPRLGKLIQSSYRPLDSDSPAIDAITEAGAYCPPTDTRGVPRPSGKFCDIGAFEYIALTPPYTPFVYSGSNQSIYPGNPLWDPLDVQVLDHYGTPVEGVTVTFTSPVEGPSGIFKDSSANTTSVTTDDYGWARAPDFISNTIVGNYVVTASVDEMTAPAEYHLSNNSTATYIDSTTGKDTNDCHYAITPCKTLDAALKQTPDSGTILIASGIQSLTSNSTITIASRVLLNGGWENNFSAQNGRTIITGSNIDGDTLYHFHVNKGAYVKTNFIEIGGGGVWIEGTLIFTNGAVTHNPKGIENRGTLEMTNVTFANNECFPETVTCGYSHLSPRILNESGAILKLTNVTMLENYYFDRISDSTEAEQAGAVYNRDGTVFLKNTLIARNRSNKGFDLFGKITSLGYNLLGIVDSNKFTPAEGDQFGTIFKPLDPMLAEPADDGSGTITAAPMTGSPAIGAGDPAACPTTDQRGAPRPAGQACNIGAYEGSVPFTDPQPNILVFSGQAAMDIPGYLTCQSPLASCTNGDDPEADTAYQMASEVFHFYWDHYRRNGVDGAGTPIVATVHSTSTTNSYWSGRQVVFANKYVNADDVVAHELTHAVIQYEAGLFYYYQSGAINESLADMWGEYFDQTNGKGNDADSVKWLIGEDAPGQPARSMSNPPAYGDPDRISSSLYTKTTSDNGGVHTNSGVNNKAVYLMVNGGSFNKKTVAPLGWEKTGYIYYYALSHLLTSGSDYADLSIALDQACQTVAGQRGISLADCQQVRNATDAVQMSNSPNIETGNTCPTGMSKVPQDLFFDDFESGDAKIGFETLVGNNRWSILPGTIKTRYATSGQAALLGNDYDESRGSSDQVSDSYTTTRNDITIPASWTTYLFFRHAFGFEVGSGRNYDGGVLEYSIDQGATWKDGMGMFESGRNYNGTIYKTTHAGSNPLQGRKAFVGASQGYISSRYNLSSLAGKNVSVRWRMGTDYTGWDLGWLVDDVEIYSCASNPGVPSLISPADKSLTTNYLPTLDWKDAANANHYWLQVANDPNFSNLLIDKQDVALSEFPFDLALPDNKTLYWHVLAVNSIGINSNWSKVFSLRTPMLPPSLAIPGDHSAPINLRPTFQWNSFDTATSYSLQVSISATFSSTLVNTTKSALTFTPTSNLTANKNLFWRVKANGANPSNWSTAFVFMIPNPPDIPHLAGPEDKSFVDSTNLLLDWTDVTPPLDTPYDHYLLQIANDAAFSNRLPDIRVNGLANSQKTLDDPLQPNQTYYWRVSAGNDLGQASVWSSARSFRTRLLTPALIIPADKITVLTTRPAFNWNDVPGATSYAIQLSTSPSFTSTVVNTSLTSSIYTPTSDLPRDKNLYWHVQAKGTNPSAWSPTFTFHSANPPGIPTLISPANNSIELINPPILQWSAINGADHYQVQVATSSLFFDASLVYFQAVAFSTAPTTITLPDLLTTKLPFYWRVRSLNAGGQYSLWSSVRSFHPSLPAPTLTHPDQWDVHVPPLATFSWNPVDEATSYILQVSINYDFKVLVINKTITTTSYTLSTPLGLNKEYEWRVKAVGTYPSPWSETRSIYVQ